METGEINKAYLHELGTPGLNSFYLSGQEITLKAGSIWIAECPNGYNILYYCNEEHGGCQLVLCTHIIRIVN